MGHRAGFARDIYKSRYARVLLEHTSLSLCAPVKPILTGIVPSREMKDELLSSRPGDHQQPDPTSDRGINFTMFLTVMGEKLIEFDPEAELVEAFECFDENDTGYVDAEEMREWLGSFGERMDATEVRWMMTVHGSYTKSNETD